MTGSYDGEFTAERRHAVCSHTANTNWDIMDWESGGSDYWEFRKYDLKLPLIPLVEKDCNL